MANWIKRNNQWFNQLQIASMRVGQCQDDQQWHMYYTFNGTDWLMDFQQFASSAAAQTFLDTYAGGLG